MSSDLERMLRDAREALPEPGDDATQRVRGRSVSTVRRRRRRARIIVLVGAMLVAAVALGVTAGSLNAPTGTAAREPAVIGFVPEQGWFALQSPPPAVPGQQTAAVAANVPFAADDVVHGLVEPSGLPYSTLLSLTPRGIVLVATMTPETSPHIAPIPTNPIYPKVELPLRVRDGVPWVQWGAQVRPDQPLAQYQLRASIRDYNVDVFVYFGTSRPSKRQLDEAQRQLEGLVVRSQQSASAPARAGVSRQHRSPRRHRSDVRLQYEHSRGHLRAQEPRARRSSERLGMVEAPLRRREQWGLGRPADRSTERSEQHARLDHRGRAVGVHHRRRRRGGVPGPRRRDDRREQLDVPPVEGEGRAQLVRTARRRCDAVRVGDRVCVSSSPTRAIQGLGGRLLGVA